MRGVVVGGNLVPQRLGGCDLVHMQNGDIGVGESGNRESENAGGSERIASNVHGFLHEIQVLDDFDFFCPRCELNFPRLPASVKAETVTGGKRVGLD